MEKELREQIFYNEDEPQYKKVYVMPYFNNKEQDQTFIYLRNDSNNQKHAVF